MVPAVQCSTKLLLCTHSPSCTFAFTMSTCLGWAALPLLLLLAVGLPAASRPTAGATVVGLNADPMVSLHRLSVVDLATGKAT